ncbi:MAG: DNA polymerase III subunit delta [Dehalococcoidia bacterium]|nr:DNA polymerase III subunit delta [Dehalococcoidia bacterium]MDW8119281.1 DNA polymerase III subunit delta [Chloroflexota bacterium]
MEPRVFLFYGADSYRVHRAVHDMLQRLLVQAGELGEGLNLQRLEGENLTPDALRTACWTPPFLGNLRIVVVRDLLGRWGGERGRRQSDASLNPWRDTLKRLVEIPPFTRLLFWEGALRNDHPLVQTLWGLEPLVRVEAFERLSYHEMARFLEEEAHARSLTLTSEGVNALVEHTWPDLWMATSHLDKLALLFPNRSLTRSEVETALPAGGTTVFRLLDALFAGDSTRALALVHILLQQGETVSGILALVGRELRALAIAREMRSEGAPVSAIQEALALPEQRVRQVLRRAERISLQRVALFYDRLLHTDLSIKQGVQDEEVALTTLVADLCRLGATGYS